MENHGNVQVREGGREEVEEAAGGGGTADFTLAIGGSECPTNRRKNARIRYRACGRRPGVGSSTLSQEGRAGWGHWQTGELHRSTSGGPREDRFCLATNAPQLRDECDHGPQGPHGGGRGSGDTHLRGRQGKAARSSDCAKEIVPYILSYCNVVRCGAVSCTVLHWTAMDPTVMECIVVHIRLVRVHATVSDYVNENEYVNASVKCTCTCTCSCACVRVHVHVHVHIHVHGNVMCVSHRQILLSFCWPSFTQTTDKK